MKNWYLKTILIFILFGCSGQAPLAQNDSEYQLPNRADIAEAAVVMPAVSSYYSILQMSVEIDPILMKAASGIQFSESDRSVFSGHIADAKSHLDAANLEAASLPLFPPELSGDELDQASQVRKFLPRLQAAAENQILGWERQFLALENADQKAYEALLKDEIDSSILLIEAANMIGRARLSGVDPAAPAYHVQDAIVLGNDTVIAFMKLANPESQNLNNNGDTASEMAGLLSDLEATINIGETKVSSVRRQFEETQETRSSQALLNVMDCVQDSLDNEKKVLAELQVYQSAAASIANESFDESEQQKLQSAEAKVATLSAARSALKFRCYELGIAFQEIASSQ